jgi:hypothetical protein
MTGHVSTPSVGVTSTTSWWLSQTDHDQIVDHDGFLAIRLRVRLFHDDDGDSVLAVVSAPKKANSKCH